MAAAAAQRGASVVAVDFSEAMLAEARRHHPAIDFRTGDAEALPFPEASFDAVVMSFGLLHLARPDQALAEAHRVLRPGGRLAFTVWDRPEEAVAFGIVLGAVQRHGRMDVPLAAGAAVLPLRRPGGVAPRPPRAGLPERRGDRRAAGLAARPRRRAVRGDARRDRAHRRDSSGPRRPRPRTRSAPTSGTRSALISAATESSSRCRPSCPPRSGASPPEAVRDRPGARAGPRPPCREAPEVSPRAGGRSAPGDSRRRPSSPRASSRA